MWKVYKRVFSPKESCLILPNLSLFMSRGWFNKLNEAGIAVILYGTPGGSIHSPEGFEAARKVGANGICSDHPSLLKTWLKKNPLKSVKNKTF